MTNAKDGHGARPAGPPAAGGDAWRMAGCAQRLVDTPTELATRRVLVQQTLELLAPGASDAPDLEENAARGVGQGAASVRAQVYNDVEQARLLGGGFRLAEDQSPSAHAKGVALDFHQHAKTVMRPQAPAPAPARPAPAAAGRARLALPLFIVWVGGAAGGRARRLLPRSARLGAALPALTVRTRRLPPCCTSPRRQQRGLGATGQAAAAGRRRCRRRVGRAASRQLGAGAQCWDRGVRHLRIARPGGAG